MSRFGVMQTAAILALMAAGLAAGPAIAHEGEPPAPHDLSAAWNFDPLVVAGLLLSGYMYARGVTSLWKRAGQGRGVSIRQVSSFIAGLLVLVMALVSPLDALSEVLFSAHMTQHMLLVLLAAPLLAYGMSPALFVWAQPKGWRRRTGRWWQRQGWRAGLSRGLSHHMTAWVLHVLALLAWHIPALYQAALENSLLHILEHLSFLLTALLYWYQIIQVLHKTGKLGSLQAVFSLFTLALVSGLLGALITFSSDAWYAAYANTVPWGLTPLDDQQLAGVIMWVPGGVVYLLVVLALLWHILAGHGNEAEPRWDIPELSPQVRSGASTRQRLFDGERRT